MAKKEVIWPEPKLGQKDLFVEFIIHKFRATFRAQPKYFGEDHIKEYIYKLIEIRDMTEKATTEEEIMNVIKLVDNKRDEEGFLYYNRDLLFYRRLKIWKLTKSQMKSECFGIDKKDITYEKAKQNIKMYKPEDFEEFDFKKGWAYLKERIFPFIFKISPSIEETQLEKDKVIIVDKDNIVSINTTEEEYRQRLFDRVTLLEEEKKKSNKNQPRIAYKHLKNIIHSGSDYRENRHITPEVLQEKFMFYGGQFGNCATCF